MCSLFKSISADWMNIMTYDATEECNHSSLIRCMKSLDYWHSIRKVPRNKIMIGAAFYARPSAKLYCELIEEDDKNFFRDSFKDDTFNGCYTTKEKTYFARLNCGGLAIWAINYDSLDNKPINTCDTILFLSSICVGKKKVLHFEFCSIKNNYHVIVLQRSCYIQLHQTYLDVQNHKTNPDELKTSCLAYHYNIECFYLYKYVLML